MFTKTFPIILLTAICIGCDPARILIIDSGKKLNASVTVYSNKSIYPHYDGGVEANQSMVVRVPPLDSMAQRKQRFYYGFGVWSPEEVSSFSSGIDSIVFTGSKQTWSLQTFDEIKAYLLKHRGGILKNSMKIKG